MSIGPFFNVDFMYSSLSSLRIVVYGPEAVAEGQVSLSARAKTWMRAVLRSALRDVAMSGIQTRLATECGSLLAASGPTVRHGARQLAEPDATLRRGGRAK